MKKLPKASLLGLLLALAAVVVGFTTTALRQWLNFPWLIVNQSGRGTPGGTHQDKGAEESWPQRPRRGGF
jgi:hypothetical protein